MNMIIFKGGLLEMSGKVRQKVAGFTGSRPMYYRGKRDEWLGKAVKGYGRLKETVQHFID